MITGEISDATSLNPLAGAIIEVTGAGRTTESDAKGRFILRDMPPGNWTLEVTKLGYFTGSLELTTLDGQPADARLGLRAKPVDESANEFTLEEETVVGEYREEAAEGLFSPIDVNETLASGLSKEDFTKTGVSDAAGAVGKISGANVVGGKYAVVRGLADRYVTTQFNGALISSADPSRKAVQLDIFPTAAIQSIDIAKTYFPNLPGDFGGGTIMLNSLRIPDERIAEFKYKITWNSNLDDRMLVHPTRELGQWGDVDQRIPDSLLWNLDAQGNPVSFNAGGNRVVPNNNNRVPSQQQAQVAAGLTQQALADATVGGARQLDAMQPFMPKVESPEEAHSYSLVYGDRITFSNGGQLGFIGAFQHSTSDEVSSWGEENRLTSPARSWMQESYSREVDWSGYFGAAYKPDDHHELAITYFKKHIATDEITHGSDYQVSGSDVFGAFARNDEVIRRYGASAVFNKEFWTIDPIIRDTELWQIGGKHRNDTGTAVNWSITKSTALESRPHTSTFQHGELDFTDPRIAAEAAADPAFVYQPQLGKIGTIQYQTFVNDGNGSLDSSRETQAIEESALEASMDIRQAVYLTDKKEDGPRFEFSLGGSMLSKEREQTGRVYLLRTASWERWVARNPASWWPRDGSIAPFAPGSPLDGTTLADGSPLPAGFGSLGEYLAANPAALADYYNGYGSENTGRVPGTGTASTAANYVQPDAPFYLNGSGLEVRNVDSQLTLTGLYAAGVYYAESWRLGGGFRWEEEIKSYEVAADPLTRMLPNDPARFGTVETSVLIPSIIGGFDVRKDRSWVNFAWSSTVARPTFHEFLPIESVDQGTGIIRRGNPTLSETIIDNLDLAYEFMLGQSFKGTISLFNKQLTEPIVAVQRVDQGVNSVTYVNGDSGEIRGFELEAAWKGEGPFSLTANYTFIDSTLEYQVNQGTFTTPLETRFPFQPGQILNLTLGWEPEGSPWSAFLTTNFTDEYPTILRSDPASYDVWLNPQLTLDLLVARKFKWGILDGTVTLGVKNLLGTSREYEYRGDGVSDGLTYTEDDPGTSYYVELKARF